MADTREAREMPPGIGLPAEDDIFTDNVRFGDIDAWNCAAVRIHEDLGGFSRIERAGFPPILAVLDHAAVLEVERQPELFTNGPAPVLTTQEALDNPPPVELKTLIHMDGDEHTAYRKLGLPQFKPASLDRLQGRLDELSERAVATMRDAGGELDFSTDVALPYPLHVILKILGLPEDDYPRMLQLTQQLFGGEDPDLQREELSPEAIGAILMDFMTYFSGVTIDRRTNPTDDLASLIANGRLGDGPDAPPLGDLETIGYYIIVATAGHDTTSSAMAGGFRALVEHPDQLRLLQDRPELMNNAIEEMLRWTAPVRHFMRCATADTDLHGHRWRRASSSTCRTRGRTSIRRCSPIRCASTSSVRTPIVNSRSGSASTSAWGRSWPVWSCGRCSTGSIPLIESVEIAGEATMSQTTFVGGPKALPIRYTLSDA